MYKSLTKHITGTRGDPPHADDGIEDMEDYIEEFDEYGEHYPELDSWSLEEIREEYRELNARQEEIERRVFL